MPTELWNSDEACAFLKIAPMTLQRWRRHKNLPYIKINATVRFDPDAIAAWAKAQAVVDESSIAD